MKHQERSHKTKSPQSRIPSVRLKSRILTENEGEIIEENDIKAGNQTVDYQHTSLEVHLQTKKKIETKNRDGYRERLKTDYLWI